MSERASYDPALERLEVVVAWMAAPVASWSDRFGVEREEVSRHLPPMPRGWTVDRHGFHVPGSDEPARRPACVVRGVLALIRIESTRLLGARDPAVMAEVHRQTDAVESAIGAGGEALREALESLATVLQIASVTFLRRCEGLQGGWAGVEPAPRIVRVELLEGGRAGVVIDRVRLALPDGKAKDPPLTVEREEGRALVAALTRAPANGRLALERSPLSKLRTALRTVALEVELCDDGRLAIRDRDGRATSFILEPHQPLQ